MTPPHSPLHGLWRIIPSPALTEIFAQVGLNFQIFDCEHGAYDYATLLPDIIACERHGCAPLIRVSGTSQVEVQRCLDLGASGLVFPQLATPEDFARAAAMMDHAPAGTRGFNPFVRASGYGVPAGSPRSRPWFVPIVETLEAVRHIEAIVALPRIDMIYIGSYDLSAQLGCPGKMDAPELAAVVTQVIAACQKGGKAVGHMALTESAALSLGARGVQCLVHGVDSTRIKQGVGLTPALRALSLPAGSPILSP